MSEPRDGGGPDTAGISRRRLLTSAGGGALGVALGGGVGYALGRESDQGATATPQAAPDAVPFHGEHQAGITTPTQNRLVFAAFDVTAGQGERAA